MIRHLYRTVAFFMPTIFYAAGFFSKKMREGWAMRQRSPWFEGPRNTAPIWIHCASGEFEYAKPVIRQLKLDQPHLKIMVTYFSPSVRASVENHTDVDIALPAPWESPKLLRAFIAYHRPRALLIARTDAWPEMTYQARAAGLNILLFSATLVPSSGRLTWPMRALTELSLRDLTDIYCVSENDSLRFAELGAKAKTKTMGDTRFDQVLFRLEASTPLAKFLRLEVFDDSRVKIVCGSTWPDDERQLIRAMRELSDGTLKLQWILAPHEPTAEHLEPLVVQVRSLGLKVGLYSELHDASADVIIIDRLGILAELYQLGELAFVGGSFRQTVHSVMEPLAAGCLTFVGPFYQNNREAIQFHLAGAVQVARDGHAMAREMRTALALGTLAKQERRQAIIQKVRDQSGGSDRVAKWVANRPSSPLRDPA